ncbi:hypothetical protein [Rubripirellula obstinata]|nr:hypothetical protein [Rubripirellula obstinata]
MLRPTLVSICVFTFVASIAYAADPTENPSDQIWLSPPKPTSSTSNWYAQPIDAPRGRVIEFDATRLTYAVESSDRKVTVAADRVLWIEPSSVPEDESTMIRLFEAGEFGKSLSYLPDVLKARPPVWRQQWLTMMSACAAHRSGRAKIALDLVEQLDRRPLPPMVIAWLPIQWNGGLASGVANQQAGERIDDESLLVQLVAASWMLTSPDRSTAINKLQSLTRNRDRLDVARLAQVLLWTTKPPAEVIESESKWLVQLDSFPMVMQAGPSMALQRKLRASGQIDSANRLLWSNQLTPIHRWLGLVE